MVVEALNQGFQAFVERIAVFLPNLLAGVLFLILAYFGIKLVMRAARTGLRARYTDSLIRNLIASVISIFLWFTTILVLLNILGLGAIAASLGTMTGFTALGVAYALSNMIADTVSGYYLVRDPDFEVGDEVKTLVDDMEGQVMEVGLRKSRLELENGDIAVLSNSEIEKKWVKKFE